MGLVRKQSRVCFYLIAFKSKNSITLRSLLASKDLLIMRGQPVAAPGSLQKSGAPISNPCILSGDTGDLGDTPPTLILRRPLALSEASRALANAQEALPTLRHAISSLSGAYIHHIRLHSRRLATPLRWPPEPFKRSGRLDITGTNLEKSSGARFLPTAPRTGLFIQCNYRETSRGCPSLEGLLEGLPSLPLITA